MQTPGQGNSTHKFIPSRFIPSLLASGPADVSNWVAIPPPPPPSMNSTVANSTGGFFPFGVSGMFQGVALFLFTFIGFDSMAHYPLNWYTSKVHQIDDFHKTVTTSILTINGILSLALLGAAIALTSMWPYYSLVSVRLMMPNECYTTGYYMLACFYYIVDIVSERNFTVSVCIR